MRRCFAGLVVLLATVAAANSALARHYSSKEEQEIGRYAAAEIKREYRFLKAPEQLNRVAGILKSIAPVTQRPALAYSAKILDTDDVTAFCLPGGYVYVSKGLLERVETDDELAGVLAHEVAHNALQHTLEAYDKAFHHRLPINWLFGVLPVADRDGMDPEVAWRMYGGGSASPCRADRVPDYEVFLANALQGYGRKAELEADHAAVVYLVKTQRWNPAGLLQLMESLDRVRQRRLGFFVSALHVHAATQERL